MLTPLIGTPHRDIPVGKAAGAIRRNQLTSAPNKRSGNDIYNLLDGYIVGILPEGALLFRPTRFSQYRYEGTIKFDWERPDPAPLTLHP